ncbi:hypothetical protein ABPG75_012162 [Micractinium tetrahymenae]
MMLPRREQHIRVSSDRLSPAQFVLQPGGRVVIAVTQGGPQQAFCIGRDVEEAFATPGIPPGSSYEWTPPESGRYFVQSEVYPHLRSTVVVLQEEAREEVTSVPPPGTGRRSSSGTLGGSARSSLGGEPSSGVARTSSSGMASAAVDEYVSFPALGAARGAAMYTRATQTGGAAGSFSSVSRHTSTAGMGSSSSSSAVAAAAAAPSAVLRRYALPAEDEADEEPASLLDSPPGGGLRQRRPCSASAPLASAAATAAAKQQPVARSTTTLPPLGARSFSGALPADGFSVLSGGSGGSPRSGSGSERSASSTTLYVRRDKYGGMLQTTHAFASSRSVYSDSRSGGGSEETQPLLYDSRRGSGHLQAVSYSSGGSYRPYSTAAPSPPHAHPPAEEDRAPKLHKCPRCRKEYLSTINQRRCISSHLRGGGGGVRGGSIPDSAQLAAFWDGLDEAEKRAVMDLRTEHNGDYLMRQLEIQKLHRQRSGAMDQLTQEQKRLHASGMLLHSACSGRGGAAGAPAAIQSLTGAHLMRVLSEVSEGTFLFDRNPISQDELTTGNNLEAGLGALVMKRLVDAHLAAKQRQADRLQRELEDQEAAQEAQKAGRQQQSGAAGSQQQHARSSKKKPKAKAKGKAAMPAAAKPASKAAAAPAAPAPESSSASEPEDAAAAPSAAAAQSAAQQQQLAPPAAAITASDGPAAAAASDALSPPRASGEERYGSSPVKQKAGAPASGSFTNFLFGEEAEAEAEAAAEGAAEANGWRTAGSGRASRSFQHGLKPGPGRRPQQAATASGPKAGDKTSSRSSSSSTAVGRPPELPASRPASERPSAGGQAAAAGTAKPAAAPAAVPNGKMPVAASSRNAAAVAAAAAPKPLSSRQQHALPQRDSFPALPAAAAAKATSSTAVPASGAAATSGSYAAAAKAQKEGSKAKPTASEQQLHRKQAEPAAAAQQPRQQQQQQQQQQQVPATSALGSLAQQPKSWPVPGSRAANIAVPASTAAAAADAAPAPAQPEQQARCATLPVQQAAPATAVAAPAAEGSASGPLQEAAAPAAEQSAAGPTLAHAYATQMAEEAQRCTSVTPPISDAGSPPPVMMPPPGYPMPCWVVGPDGTMLPAPHFYWMPHPPPGMQYGVDPAEGGMPPGAFPYPFYPPMPYPALPAGHPASMAMAPPHMLPYPGEGPLAPFPPGMPVPLPPEVAEELAAVAAAAGAHPEGGWAGAASLDIPAEAAQDEGAAEAEAPAGGTSEQLASQPQAEQQQQQPGGTGSRKGGFLAMLQEACGAPESSAGAPAAMAAAAVSSRRRGGPPTPPAFDAEAAAAELERRWQAAAAQSVPASSLAAPVRAGAAAAVRADQRSSTGSGAGVSGKPLKPSVAKAGSGRASPAGGSKPVVVAVRAFTSDDSAGGDGPAPKWRISTAPPPARPPSQQQQHAPAKHVPAGSR